MINDIRRALILMGFFLLALGLIYPLAVTVFAQLLFPHQANGSLIEADTGPVGSELIGQGFTQPQYFLSRPSAAGKGYDAMASGGSNLAPTSAVLLRAVSERSDAISGISDAKPVPIDLVTASGSGLDPHISAQAAYLQIPRIARLRGLREEQVRLVVTRHLEGRLFGIFGQPRVNVLKVNLALDALHRKVTDEKLPIRP
jgi:K+-transporting ATPase ATPase C chain